MGFRANFVEKRQSCGKTALLREIHDLREIPEPLCVHLRGFCETFAFSVASNHRKCAGAVTRED
ncbi:MAG: hypothetical protein MSH49_08385 [[Eubacterium] saphenum]|nr:hypothetical protein [[Eubacterium] saphenum]